jgi:hypothetical protein
VPSKNDQEPEQTTPEWAHVYDFLLASSDQEDLPDDVPQPAPNFRGNGIRASGRRKRDFRPNPVHETIQEVSEPDPTPEKKRLPPLRLMPTKTSQAKLPSLAAGKPEMPASASPSRDSADSLPDLPFTWRLAAGTPSSLEKALNKVMGKLAAIEDASSETARPAMDSKYTGHGRLSRAATPREKLRRAVEMRQRRLAGNSSSTSIPPPKTAASLSVEDITVDREDRDIPNRDVLRGLRMAISAACDQDMDIWLRGRTGLRLRRFLADLKTFKNLGEDDWLPDEDGAVETSGARRDPQRYRHLREEKRQLEAEIQAARVAKENSRMER